MLTSLPFIENEIRGLRELLDLYGKISENPPWLKALTAPSKLEADKARQQEPALQ